MSVVGSFDIFSQATNSVKDQNVFACPSVLPDFLTFSKLFGSC